jgi:cytochrome c-type biogenesis protein CcmF
VEEKIQYIGEHLFPGQLGQFLILISFVTAFLSFISYTFAASSHADLSWKKLARWSFRIHSISVLGIIGALFYMLLNHYFEYQYVWQHSSKDMPKIYMLSCFWEGQEGSFLLWSFWHVVLGNILMHKSKDWENFTMPVLSVVQIFLASMLLGVYVFDYKIGSNPFILLREHPDFSNLPFVKIPTYLQNLDGRGLNPLLRNYWMIIHPPTLFLGFASTLIPFCFAIGGLWRKQYTSWIKPAIPWTIFGVMILGTGILMGGAWAYEALSFGGFWAWDPVENASLVPWIILVAALHLMLVYKNKDEKSFLSILFSMGSFILVLYSTFLTRSGVLGDASVHAFTDLGMNGQLLIYLLSFVFLSVFLLGGDRTIKITYSACTILFFVLAVMIGYKNIFLSLFAIISFLVLVYGFYKYFYVKQDEDAIWSREFWMFIGALVLLISAFHITFETSKPILNKLFATNYASVQMPDYNKVETAVAVILALLMGLTQFFKYKNSNIKEILRKLTTAFSLSLIFSVVLAYGLNLFIITYFLLLVSSLFCIFANADYAIRILKGKVKNAGAAITHIGFGLMLIGILISMGKQNIISQNTSEVDIQNFGKEYKNGEHILMQINDTLKMDDYLVSYRGKEKEGVNFHYNIEYLKKNKSGEIEKAFTLRPIVQINPRMGNVAEPATKHFLYKDVYTHITWAEINDTKAEETEEFDQDSSYTLSIGDSVIVANRYFMTINSLEKEVDKRKYNLQSSDLAVGASVNVIDADKRMYQLLPIFVIRENFSFSIAAESKELGLKLSFDKILPDQNEIVIKVLSKNVKNKEFIIMKAIVFPGINLLWSGAIIFIIGCLIALIRRMKE